MPVKTASGSQMLDRSKLHSVPADVPSSDTSTVRSVVILALLVVFVGIVGAFFVKNYKADQSKVIPTPTPEPTKIVEEEVIEEDKKITFATEIKDTSALSKITDLEKYTNENVVLENDSDIQYALEEVEGQPYTDFYRTIFKFENEDGDEAGTPLSEITYKEGTQEIEITFRNVNADNTGILLGEVFPVENSILVSVVKSMRSSGTDLVYKLKLEEETKYYAQMDGNTIIIDVLESTEVIEDELLEDSEVQDEISQSTTDIKSEATGLVAGIKGYSYDDYNDKFVYQLKLSNANIPNVSSVIKTEDGAKKLYVTIENLVFDGIASNDEYGEVDFTTQGVKNVTTLTSSYENGVSTYVFDLSGDVEYKIELNEEDYSEKRILISFGH